MFEITKKSLQWGGRELTIETGKIARQADGAVIVTYGETQVLATAVGVKENDGSNDFFPLTVHYIEKFSKSQRSKSGNKIFSNIPRKLLNCPRITKIEVPLREKKRNYGIFVHLC